MNWIYRASRIALGAMVAWAIVLSWGRAQGRRPPWPTEPVTAIVDGKIQTFEALKIDGVACLSLDDVQTIFGGRQSWRRVSRQVSYRLGKGSVDFVLDQSSVSVNGRAVATETAVRWWGNAPYIPVSLLARSEFQEFSNNKIIWEPSKRVVSIDPTPEISSPRYMSYPHKSRVSVDVANGVDYRVMSQQPTSLFVRLFGGRANEGEKLSVDDGLISSVEVLPKSHSTDLRLTLSTAAATPQVFLLDSPRRLVIDVPRALSAHLSQENSSPGPDLMSPGLGIPGIPLDLPEKENKSTVEKGSPFTALSPLRTIVIDPGHGGKDAGAAGPHGTLEKDVNLKIAKTLMKILSTEGRYNIILTRDDDTFVPLQERSNIANKNKADLFISIHCNAGLTHKSQGFEIFFLSEKATDDDAAAVARRENAVVELEGITGQARQKLEDLLWSMARTETLNDSSEMAGLIAAQAKKRLSLIYRGVKQARFYVLRGTTMPAVLIESGFITHPKEEGLLRSERYHRKIADAIYAGVLDFEKRKIQSRLQQPSAGGDR